MQKPKTNRRLNPDSKPLQVGIDILSLKRVSDLMKRHGPLKVRSLLSTSEKKRLKSKQLTVEALAKNLCAKEAFFKATSRSWMGPFEFSCMTVRLRSHDRFDISWRSNDSSSVLKGAGAFFAYPQGIGAQVITVE